MRCGVDRSIRFTAPRPRYIPVIAGLMAKYDHGVLVLACSLCRRDFLMGLGIARLGKDCRLKFHIRSSSALRSASRVTIGLSQIGEILGLKAKMGYAFFDKLRIIADNLGQVSPYAIVLGLGTFLLTKYILKVSVFIPAPLIAHRGNHRNRRDCAGWIRVSRW